MSNPPTGTVTFLFTDIEGSTKRWEQHPQAMQAALERHDDILRTSIEANNGYVFKTVGDAFCAAFPTALDALAAALAAHRALQGEPWNDAGPLRIRVGLHTGMAQERDGDYFGQALNRVARLQAAGHGLQTLLSLPTYELVRDHLPQGVSLQDLGEHRLKDLFRPERIFQALAPDLPAEFPPLKTLDNRPNNLPVQPTPLIGREAELAAVEKLLLREDVRLVTLTGAGGSGKTRLGLQAAADLLDDLERFEDGAYFVNLAPLTDPGLVISTIAQTLGVKEVGGQALIETLRGYLKDKRMLLVLDNFEQVGEAAGEVSELLAYSAGLKVLCTSRVPLRIRGEKEYAVSPLELPDIKHLPPIERLTQYEAVRLFIERASDVKADFQVTNENAPSVAEICVRLDGLPLAIELAAARVKMLPPHALLSRLSQRLKFLTGGARDLTARQQTLRGAIDWSYDLLDEGRKELFRRMAVFSGGRTLEALEGVCNYDGDLQVDVFEGAETLLGSNLLQQREGSDGEPRFWMLETIHEYAREKLGESGEAEALEREHALYFMRLAEEAEPYLRGTKQVEWLHRLEEEHDNLRAAMRWARAAGEGSVAEGTGVRGENENTNTSDERADGDVEPAEVGLRIAGSLWRFWYVRGYYSEGREQLAAILALSTPSTVQALPSQSQSQSQSRRSFRARALYGAGTLAYGQGDYAAARSLLEESISMMRELGDKSGLANSLNNLGNMADRQGDYAAARSLYEESFAIRRELGDKYGIASSLNNLGIVAHNQGDYAAARSLLEESISVIRELGDKGGIANSLHSLGNVTYNHGDYAAARSLYEESLAMKRELGDKGGIAWLLDGLGNVAYSQGDYAAARSLYEESLAMKRELGDKGGIALSLAGLGGVAAGIGQTQTKMQAQGQGQAERGARLLGAAEALMEAISAVLGAESGMVSEQGVASARAQLSEEEFDKAWAEGRAMSMEQAIEYALEKTGERG